MLDADCEDFRPEDRPEWECPSDDCPNLEWRIVDLVAYCMAALRNSEDTIPLLLVMLDVPHVHHRWRSYEELPVCPACGTQGVSV